MSADKGKKIRRFYPVINKKSIILFGIVIIFCPIPIFFFTYYFGIFKSIESAISYIVVMDLVFIISTPFIMFIIFYLQSVAIYSKGILSFNPSNNRETFMPWESMATIENEVKFSKGYYVVKSSTNKECLWIPSFLKNNRDFVKEISNHAGKNHILYKIL